MAHPLWPLFDLRVRTERLELRLPTDDEIAELMIVARTGIHEPDEMPFAAPWTKKPSPRFEREFAQWHWFNRATWTPEKWGLLFAIFLEGRPIGAQDLNGTDFAHTRAVLTGSWLGMGWQGRGFGKEMRAAVLGFAFDYLGADVAETEAYLDNARSAGVSTSLGYAPNGIGRHAPEGLPRDTQRFRMTAEMWHSRPRPTLEVDGFEACRDLFGLAEDTTET
jgi:RimJ/RimL family protein N-acetyltransferase